MDGFLRRGRVSAPAVVDCQLLDLTGGQDPCRGLTPLLAVAG
jgi:hypothetical protein